MAPPKVRTIKRGDSRFYVSPETGAKVPGVTSVLNMLPKPFLQFWAAKVVAENAVADLPALVGMALRGAQDGAVDYLKGAPRRETAAAADVGSRAHEVFERMALGFEPGRVEPDVLPFVQHYGAWLDRYQPDFLFLEETVWSDTHSYAGSFDAIAVIEGETVFLDNKTTRSGVHAEVGIQLAAYRNADSIVQKDGTRVPLPKAEAGAVVHVRPEGLRFVPVRCDDSLFTEVFLPLRKVFTWDTETSKAIVGDPIFETGYSEETTPRRRTAAPRARAARA